MKPNKIDKRYETKFNVQHLNWHQVEYVIKSHPSLFKEIFFRRQVNNIYFDNPKLSGFIDNIEGERDRKKYRIRWYGDLFGVCQDPVLEIKYKSGLLGWKERHKLNNFCLNPNEKFDYKKIFNDLLSRENFEISKLDLDFLSPTLLNRYERSYYLSFNKQFRVTLDNKMDFYSINPVNNSFKTFADDERVVVELKYDQNNLDGARNITRHFPFRVTKNSKYVVGIDRIRGWK